MTVYLTDSCISIKCYDVYSHPFVAIVFMVFVPIGCRYLERGALVARRLIGGDEDLIMLFLFSELR